MLSRAGVQIDMQMGSRSTLWRIIFNLNAKLKHGSSTFSDFGEGELPSQFRIPMTSFELLHRARLVQQKVSIDSLHHATRVLDSASPKTFDIIP